MGRASGAHIRIIPPIQTTLGYPPLLFLPLYLPTPHCILPLLIVFPQNQARTAFLLALCSTRLGIGDSVLCPSEMILKVVLEVYALLAGGGRRGDGRTEERGVTARRAEALAWVLAQPKTTD